ncbi:inositol monophosphatase family protein [Chitinispirillales bacterium ANBcel5]|uniref:inositol monophosphatase family protein n=1 Tax=Cellulosispirillum alkaliphilum TaxID=3039283 RepID=UPI002A58E69F|nr:inositol monophosphatase family protein [Chitinispirillales bacterium ANBcel5]
MNVAVEAAQQAGRFLSKHFDQSIQIERKKDHSLVTNIDKESENIIVNAIRKSFPSHSLLAEESGEQRGNEYLWLIDPLDGTHNFIRGIQMYGVCIGLVHRDEFVGGVIYLPSTDELYCAERGSGAFKNGKPLKVSNCSDLKEATLLFDSGMSEGGEEKLGLLGRMAHRFFNIRMLGASCRNMSYLAEGKADVLIEFDEKPWDFAAGAAILLEAGGVICGHRGETVNVKSKKFVASNPLINLELRKLITTV